jgi:long-subunit fatty acid transport protein
VSTRASFRRHERLALAFALLFGISPLTTSAQTNERIYEDLDFRFVTPGARAVGMGKTFIGLGDDATAAASNPAGLSNLLEQEFSIEFIGTQIKHERFIPSDNGLTQTFGDYVVTPSFLSYVVPARRATVSFFRQAVQNYRESYGFDQRYIPSLDAYEDGSFGTISVQSDNYGVSGAFVANAKLSIGGSFSYSTLSLASQGRSGAPSVRDGVLIRSNPQNGTDTIDADAAWSWVGGVLFKPVRTVAIGATYHSRATFNVETTFFGSFLRTRIPGDPDTRESVVRTGDSFIVDYVLPSRYAVGASWRPLRSLTLAADWSRILYSERVTDRFLIVDFHDPDAGLVVDETTRVCRDPCNFYVPDISEVHVGGEYRWYRPSFTLALRAGAFSDPDHQLRFRSGGNNLEHPADRILNFRFNTVQPQTHYGFTAGAGIALANWFQVDGATSISDDASEVVVSLVVRLR